MKKLVMMFVLVTSASILQAADRQLESPTADQMLAALALAGGIDQLAGMCAQMPQGAFDAASESILSDLELGEITKELETGVEGALKSSGLQEYAAQELAELATEGMITYLGSEGIKKALKNRDERIKAYTFEGLDDDFIEMKKNELGATLRAFSTIQDLITKNVALLDQLQEGSLLKDQKACKTLEEGEFALSALLWGLVYSDDICGSLKDDGSDGSLSGDQEENNNENELD